VEEEARGVTLAGPHRDDILFQVDGRSAREFASQGQQRSIALAWKLAEVGAVQEIAGTSPVLLLDDVMSELDEERRGALTDFVGGRVQTVLTTTNMGYFDPEMLESASVIHLPA
jgi:DNA replication and repair protein RecF